MKSVLISTRPKWCEKICRKIGEENGIPIYLKPVEVRKSAPKEVPFKVYVYCTNGRFDITDIDDLTSESVRVVSEGRGKVIGEFVCDMVEEYTFSGYNARYRINDVDLEKTCLNHPELIAYGKGKILYGWHVTNLKIYDKPKELGEFIKVCPIKNQDCAGCEFYSDYSGSCTNYVTRPPRGWQYVEEIEE